MRDLLDTALDTASGSNTGFLVYRLVNHRSVNHAGLLQHSLHHRLLQPPEMKKPDTWPGSRSGGGQGIGRVWTAATRL